MIYTCFLSYINIENHIEIINCDTDTYPRRTRRKSFSATVHDAMATALASGGEVDLRPAVVIGVGGASGCGKTSQSKSCDSLDVSYLHFPTCFAHIDVCAFHFSPSLVRFLRCILSDQAGPPPAYKDRLWDMEGPERIDWEAVVRDVRALALDEGTEEEVRNKAEKAAREAVKTVVEEAAEEEVERAGDTMNIIIVESFLLFSHPPLLALLSFVLFLDGRKEKCAHRRINRNPHRSDDESFHLARYYEAYVWPGYMRYTVPACAALGTERSRHDGGQHAFVNIVRVDAIVGDDGYGGGGSGAGALGGSRGDDDGGGRAGGGGSGGGGGESPCPMLADGKGSVDVIGMNTTMGRGVEITSDEVAAEMLRLAVQLLKLPPDDS
eukprot:179012-Pleurochrysis_carterae.AAC.7